MELHQLKIFVAVAEEKHLTRAAERVFSSQPAVSAQVKSLEEQLGVRLFDRTPKGMELTKAGEQLLAQARTTLAAASDMLASAKSMQGNVVGELEIGTNSDLDFLRLPQIMQHLGSRHPQLTLSLVASMSTDILSDVRKGKMDSGFFFGPNTLGGLHCETLTAIQTAVVAPVAWKDKIARASIEDLSALDWVYTRKTCPFYLLKEQLFAASGLTPNKTIFVDTEENIRACIKAGAGISLLREDDADKAEAAGWGVRWQGPCPVCPLSAAVLANRIQEPEIAAWLDALNAVWQTEQRSASVIAG